MAHVRTVLVKYLLNWAVLILSRTLLYKSFMSEGMLYKTRFVSACGWKCSSFEK